MQEAAPALEYVFPVQLAHVGYPDPLYVPDAHGLQTVLPILPNVFVPAVQLVQTPLVSAYTPAPQKLEKLKVGLYAPTPTRFTDATLTYLAVVCWNESKEVALREATF